MTFSWLGVLSNVSSSLLWFLWRRLCAMIILPKEFWYFMFYAYIVDHAWLVQDLLWPLLEESSRGTPLVLESCFCYPKVHICQYSKKKKRVFLGTIRFSIFKWEYIPAPLFSLKWNRANILAYRPWEDTALLCYGLENPPVLTSPFPGECSWSFLYSQLL